MNSFQKNKRTKISGPKKGKKVQKPYNSDLSHEISVLEGILGPNKIFLPIKQNFSRVLGRILSKILQTTSKSIENWQRNVFLSEASFLISKKQCIAKHSNLLTKKYLFCKPYRELIYCSIFIFFTLKWREEHYLLEIMHTYFLYIKIIG